MSTPIPIEITAHIVAAGIDKNAGLARITIAFTPIVIEKHEATKQLKNKNPLIRDLRSWPAEVDNLIKGAGSPAGTPLQVIALNKGQSWRQEPWPAAVPLMLTRVDKNVNHTAAITAYWNSLMSVGGNGFEALEKALDPLASDELENIQRPRDGMAKAGDPSYPDIHGTHRSRTAGEVAFERAQHILARLEGNNAQRRLFSHPEPSLFEQVKGWQQRVIAPATMPSRVSVDDVANQIEDTAALNALGGSRTRANDFTDARRGYYDKTLLPEDAVDAFWKKMKAGLHYRPPALAALEAGAPAEKSGDTEVKMDEAVAAYRLSSTAPWQSEKTFDNEAIEQPTEKEIDYARRRLYAIQTSPSLGRLFRFFVDFTFKREDLQKVLQTIPSYDDSPIVDGGNSVSTGARFVLLSLKDLLPDPLAKPPVQSLAKWRTVGSGDTERAEQFYPCTREEVDLFASLAAVPPTSPEWAMVDQTDGIINLGQGITGPEKRREPRYDIVLLDAIAATAAEYDRRLTINENMATLKKAGPFTPATQDFLKTAGDPRKRTLRGGGFALADRWRQWHATLRHVDSTQQIGNRKSGIVLLDASDLTVGYKLDVGVRIKGDSVPRNRWHSLMHRNIEYKPHGPLGFLEGGTSLDQYLSGLYPDAAAVREGEGAMLQAPIALRKFAGNPQMLIKAGFEEPKHTIAFTEEILGAWRGGPLGLATEKQEHILAEDDLRIGMIYRLPKRGTGGVSDDLVPPRLRFGWHYHFGLRSVFAGGVSMPLKDALTHYEFDRGGKLINPPACHDGKRVEGKPYLRYERIDAPTVLVPDALFGALDERDTYTSVQLRGRFPAPQAARMVVKTVTAPDNRSVLGMPAANLEDKTAGVGFDRRVLLVPSVSLEFATLHGAFDKPTEFETDVEMLEPRVRDEDEPPKREEEFAGEEFVPVTAHAGNGGLPTVRWQKLTILWRKFKIKSRPRGGLRAIDHRAAWGGFPIYRAALSDGAVKPVENGIVGPLPKPVSDEGEILFRTRGKGATIKSTVNANRTETVFWAAQGTLANEDALERAGAAVFRRLPSKRDKAVERIPYYPDPAATTLVVRATVRNDRAGEKNPLLASVELYPAQPNKQPVAKRYPDVRPVVLDIVRGAKRKIVIAEGKNYNNLPFAGTNPPQLDVCHVAITLAAGEEADIECWCVPSEVYLTHMSAMARDVVTIAIQRGLDSDRTKRRADARDEPIALEQAFLSGLQALMPQTMKRVWPAEKGNASGLSPDDRHFQGYGGLPTLGLSAHAVIAGAVRTKMLKEPVPELAAVTTIEAVHAVDLPQQLVTAKAKFDQAKFPLLRTTPERMPALLCQPCNDPLYDSATWTLANQMPDATQVLLDGMVTIHGPSTNGIEIFAEGAAAARGLFDDVTRGRSRDDRSRGLWPRPDGATYIKPKYLFGFDVKPDGKTSFEPERVTLLRLDGLPANTTDINLLAIQRDAEALAIKERALDKTNDGDQKPLRAERPVSFPDGRARYIQLFATAIARHTTALRTRYDELPPIASKTSPPKSPLAKPFWLAATVRPPRISTLSCIPSFGWKDSTPATSGAKLPSVDVTRSALIRIRVKRPWFGSGEGERLGIVIWPPNLFALPAPAIRSDIVAPLPLDRSPIKLKDLPEDGTTVAHLVDADLGPGGSWVTRWGSDPIRSTGHAMGWLLSKANFPKVTVLSDREASEVFSKAPDLHPDGAQVVGNVLMPLPGDSDAAPGIGNRPASGVMAVSLITFAPRFDPEQESWYVDVEVDPCGAVYPFLRLGLVRYQPNAPRALQVSEPIVEWAQVMPERKVKATATRIEAKQKIRIEATIEGLASSPAVAWPQKNPTERPPRLLVSLLRRWKPEDGQKLGPETVHEEITVMEPQCGADCMRWSASFTVPVQDYERPGDNWSIFVEEVERLRPARYNDEPRYKTIEDDHFAESGPKFTARLSLDNLHVGG